MPACVRARNGPAASGPPALPSLEPPTACQCRRQPLVHSCTLWGSSKYFKARNLDKYHNVSTHAEFAHFLKR
eukprot:14924730-Alexandrium_andersonii.AAC.1